MDTGLVVTFVGIIVAGLAGILGVWLERDRSAPPGWAYVFTGLILLATGLKVAHSIAQKAESGQAAEGLARVLERLVVLSENGTNPALDQFVVAELAAQSRANPEVMERLELRVEASGGDPAALRRKASAARRAAAGLPPRGKAERATKGTKATRAEAAKVGKAVEEVVAPLATEIEGEIRKIPQLPVELPAELPSIPGIGEPKPRPEDPPEGADKAEKAGKGTKNR